MMVGLWAVKTIWWQGAYLRDKMWPGGGAKSPSPLYERTDYWFGARFSAILGLLRKMKTPRRKAGLGGFSPHPLVPNNAPRHLALVQRLKRRVDLV